MESPTKIYPEAVVIPLLSIISIIVVVVPLILHAKNKNVPASCILCWFILLNIFNIINAFIWPNDNVESWWDGAGLCDIETKIMIASYVAVPGSLLCVFRNLARVLDTRCATLVPSRAQRWRNRSISVLFCVVVPVISMADHIVYQRSRYIIFSISGCVNDFDESPMSFALAFIWPPVICVIASYYCGLVLYRLKKYRSQFSQVLNASNSTYNKSRFLRLFFLSFTMLLVILPVQCFVVYYNTILSMPWHTYSWSRIHTGSRWNTIIKMPTNGHAFYDRWVPIAANFLVFIFFGSGKDANDLYRASLWNLGFGRCFACLTPEYSRRTSKSSSTTSRVKLLFHKRWSSATRTYVNNSARLSNDIEKGLTHTSQQPGYRQNQPQEQQQQQLRSWRHLAWSLLRHPLTSPHDRQHHQQHLDHNGIHLESTVHTNAWAGMSRSRPSAELSPTTPSRKDFIRVRQEISQESELQEIV